ncbi:MAG: tetratricopeptide repeat protein [Myxococcales bacterium]|nr:tetratricopeptide repeat protein [Myxococcales bacterium]
MSTVARRYYVRAVEQLRRGEVDDAAEGFRVALDMAPMFVEARVAYANALARTGDAPRAANSLRAGLARPGARPREILLVQRALGDVLIAAGDYRGAEEAYFTAAKLGDQLGVPQVDLHDRLARLRAKTGRFGEALDELLAAARAPVRAGLAPVSERR